MKNIKNITRNIKIINDIKTKLKDPLDILIYGLHTLEPCRRMEYKNMKTIREPEKYDLNDPETKYLILTSPERFILNDCETYKTHGQQIYYTHHYKT